MEFSRRSALSVGLAGASLSTSQGDRFAQQLSPTPHSGAIQLARSAPRDGRSDAAGAIQALLDAHPSHAILDGEGGQYRIDRPLRIPAGSRFLTLRNLTLLAGGDSEILSAAGLAHFFVLESALIDCGKHSAKGRAAVDFSGFSQSTFRDVWVTGSPGRTVAFYGRGSGSSPYYNHFEHCYVGNALCGILMADASGPPDACNSNAISFSRFQPGKNGTGIFIGRNNQNTSLICNQFESKGGTGVHVAGLATLALGSRLEGLATGMNYAAEALGTLEIGSYADSNAAERMFAGAARQHNSVIGGVTGTRPEDSSLAGTLDAIRPADRHGPGPMIATPHGGRVIDTEARAAISAILDLLSNRGAI